MKRFKKFTLALVVTGIVITGVLILGSFLALGPKPVVAISFLGYRTEADGSKTATCRIRNVTGENIVLLAHAPQLQSEDGWQWSQQAGATTKRFFTAGMVANVDVPAPKPTVTWRVAVMVRSSRQERIAVKFGPLISRWLGTRPRQELFGRYFFSLPIPPIESHEYDRPPQRPAEGAVSSD